VTDVSVKSLSTLRELPPEDGPGRGYPMHTLASVLYVKFLPTGGKGFDLFQLHLVSFSDHPLPPGRELRTGNLSKSSIIRSLCGYLSAEEFDRSIHNPVALA
jgi:hypothetical protein